MGVRGTARETTRAALLAAARALYEAHGWERVNARMIAERAARQPAAIYEYWASLAALFREAMGRPVITDAMGWWLVTQRASWLGLTPEAVACALELVTDESTK